MEGQGLAHEVRRGWIFGAGAYAAWGLFPLYWPLLEPAGALEILAHRIAWTLVFVAILLRIRPRRGWWQALRARPRVVPYLVAAALIIGVNWGLYIWGVNSGHVVETSLGYFTNPLVTMLLGVLVLRERLTRPQWVAMAIAGVAVVVLTLNYGRPPWIALGLAFSFALYALCKKQASAGAVESLTVETTVLMPLALAYLAILQFSGGLTFGHAGPGKSLLLAGAGVATAIPLLMFAGAASRIPLSSLGVLQYIAPTLQFLCGVLIYGEPMPPVRLLGFALVWVALVLFTWEALRIHRRTLAARPLDRDVPDRDLPGPDVPDRDLPGRL